MPDTKKTFLGISTDLEKSPIFNAIKKAINPKETGEWQDNSREEPSSQENPTTDNLQKDLENVRVDIPTKLKIEGGESEKKIKNSTTREQI